MLHADDRWAINDTISMHGNLIDGGHLDRLEELFTPDVVYDMSAVGLGVFEGLETVRGAARQMEDRGVGPVAHHVTNVVIAAEEGDEATVESKGLMVMRDGALESVTHRDTVRRQDGGWRISRRNISPLPSKTRPSTGTPVDHR
jgi:ketosteroid isomerase-like protein